MPELSPGEGHQHMQKFMARKTGHGREDVLRGWGYFILPVIGSGRRIKAGMDKSRGTFQGKLRGNSAESGGVVPRGWGVVDPYDGFSQLARMRGGLRGDEGYVERR
eukprot:760845-Hanusia_phi.AAC.5